MKQHYCFLRKFNNYFNRKIIRYEILDDYIDGDNPDDAYIPTDSQGNPTPFDFNPNDNVTTEIIANDVPFEPDYFLLLNPDQSIAQRWFVMEQKRNRNGQWSYTLRRDVIADNYYELLNSPIYVQKGMLSDTDPLVLNSEGVRLNQIKTEETLLRDKTKSAYLVGYVAKQTTPTDVNVQVNQETIKTYVLFSAVASDVGVSESTLASILDFGSTRTTKSFFTNSIRLRFYSSYITSSNSYRYLNFFTYNEASNDVSYSTMYDPFGIGTSLYHKVGQQAYSYTNFKNAMLSNINSLKSQIPTIASRSYYLTTNQLETLKKYVGVPIKYLNKYYYLTVDEVQTRKEHYLTNSAYTTYSSIKTICETGNTPETDGKIADLTLENVETYLGFSEINDSDIVPIISAKMSGSRNTCDANAYDMFVIPLNAYIKTQFETFQCNETFAKNIASALAIELDTQLYDLQLLPYFPMEENVNLVGTIQAMDLTEDEDYNLIMKDQSSTGTIEVLDDLSEATEGSPNNWSGNSNQFDLPAGATVTSVTFDPDYDNIWGGSLDDYDVRYDALTGKYYIDYRFIADAQDMSDVGPNAKFIINYTVTSYPVGIIFYPKKSSFQRNLDYSLSLKTSMKVDSNCDLYRLVSPNYQGTFEFNVAKAGGNIDYFIAYCTYKPYTPYIKVVPQFNYLYGTNFGDNRGLICGGDFSFPRINSAWENYQLNNKNYQNIFNRDIQHLDFEQSIETRVATLGAVTGVVGDTAKGALTGAVTTGSPYGAIAGGVLGGTASTIGGALDLELLASRQREAKQLAVDKFNLTLGNVRALPYTLTKVGTFDINSKIFPFLEYYTCTDEEREMFETKIKWESMTVGKIDTCGNYFSQSSDKHYFKGELIRNEDIADDPHTFNAIYEELLKGVYI